MQAQLHSILNNLNEKIRCNFVSTLFVFYDCVLVVAEDLCSILPSSSDFCLVLNMCMNFVSCPARRNYSLICSFQEIDVYGYLHILLWKEIDRHLSLFRTACD